MTTKVQRNGQARPEAKVEDRAVEEAVDYVTMTIADPLFGIPVLQVQDVLGQQRITRIPLAPPELAGSLHLRGRLATSIDSRLGLGLRTAERRDTEFSIVRNSPPPPPP